MKNTFLYIAIVTVSFSSCILENDDYDSPPSKYYNRAGHFVITSIANNEIQLQWSNASIQYMGGTPSYYSTIRPKTNTIERADLNGLFSPLAVLSGDSISYKDNTLDSTKSYFYRIESKFINDTILYSDTVIVRFGSTYSILNTIPYGNTADFMPDGKKIVTLRGGGTIEMWDVNSGALLGQKNSKPNFQSWMWSFTLSPSGKYIAAVGEYYDSSSQTIRGEINVLNFNDSTLFLRYHNQQRTQCAVFGLTDEEIISGGMRPTLAFWKIPDGINFKESSPDSIFAFNLAIDRTHSLLAIASSSNNVIRLVNINSGEIVRSLSGHNDHTYLIAFSRDGKYLVTDAKDNKIAFWNVETGSLIRTIGSSSDYLTSIAISPDNSLIFGGYENGRIRVWNSTTGKMYRTIAQHNQSISRIIISPDGTKLLSCSSDKTVVWSLLNNSNSEWYLEE